MVRLNEEEKNPVMRYAVIVVTVIVSAIILFSLIPIIGVANSETRTADNDGASDLKFSLEKSKSFTRTYRMNDGMLNITGGVEEITVLAHDMIVYADDHLCILSKGYNFYMVADGYISPAPSVGQWFTIKSDSSGTRITPGYGADVGVLNFAKHTWAYVPNMDGGYAYFQNGTEVTLTEGSVEAVAGLYGGWGAYNRVAFDLHTDRTEDAVSSAYWSIAVEGSTEYTAPDPILADVPRVISADGNWRYVVEDGNARPLEYIGASPNVTVPAEIDSYKVITVGSGTGSGYVFSSDITSLTISEGIKNIASFSFYQDTGVSLTGNVRLPSTLEYIGSQSFRYAQFSGNLTIPQNVGYIGYNAFEGCAFTTLAVEGSAAPLTSAYASTPIREVLNVSDAEYTTTSYGLSADSVSDQITAYGFIANEHYTYSAQRTGTIAALFWLLPLIFLIGLAVYFIHRINNHNEIIGGWKR